MKRRTRVDRMANGHLAIWTNSWIRATSIAIRLRWFHGFKRTGKRIMTPIDESIYPDFVRGNVRILAGWEGHEGYHFLATNEESDAFLEKFFGSHS
jgi:hypothetical protein